jgi:hypothetical protein
MEMIVKQIRQMNKTLNKIEKFLFDKKPSVDDFISEYDAKKKFKRGTTWFWNLRKTGFPYTKLGGEVYYSQTDLYNYLNNNKKGGLEEC